MIWTDLLTRAVHQDYAATDKLMALVSDDELTWKPATGKNWMTLGQVLMHLTNACGYCCNAFLTGNWGPPEGVEIPEGAVEGLVPAEALPTVDNVRAARDLLAADKQLALDAIATAGEDKLVGETVAAPWCPECALTYGEQFMGMLQHQMSHRHQLFYYLKLMDKDVNTMHLWGV